MDHKLHIRCITNTKSKHSLIEDRNGNIGIVLQYPKGVLQELTDSTEIYTILRPTLETKNEVETLQNLFSSHQVTFHADIIIGDEKLPIITKIYLFKVD